MQQSDINELNEYFLKKDIKEACFANCIEEHDCLVIGIIELGKNPVGVLFYNTHYVSGPFRWNDVNFECSLYDFEDGMIGVELEDKKTGFVLRSYGPVKLGDTGKIIPSS